MNTGDLREQVAQAVQGVLWNASNHPNPAAVMGRDVTPLTAKVADALMPLIAQARAEAEAQAFDEGWFARAAYDPSGHDEPVHTNPYTERTDR